jgi:hypothetical protein
MLGSRWGSLIESIEVGDGFNPEIAIESVGPTYSIRLEV